MEGDDLVVEGPSGEARLPIGAAPAGAPVAPAWPGAHRGAGGDVGSSLSGRRPNTDSLGLSQAGVRLDPDGRITVAADRRAAKDVYAIGDITPGPALAHKATAEADVAVTAAGGRRAAFDPATIPAVVFSDPQIATVGLTAEQAAEDGADATTFRFPLSASGRALALGRPEGYVEIVTERGGGPAAAPSSASTWSEPASPNWPPRPPSPSRWAPPPRTSPSPSPRTPPCPKPWPKRRWAPSGARSTSAGERTATVSAYVLVEVEVENPERYAEYRPLAAESLAKHGGRFLVRGGKTEVLEGEWFRRIVVLEFDSLEAAHAWYYSDEYQAAVACATESSQEPA